MGTLLSTPNTSKLTEDGSISLDFALPPIINSSAFRSAAPSEKENESEAAPLPKAESLNGSAASSNALDSEFASVEVKWGVCCMQGWRKHQEDAFSINYYPPTPQEMANATELPHTMSSRSTSFGFGRSASPVTVSGGYLLLSVFDGHGGPETSHYCKERFNDFLIEQIRTANGEIQEKIIQNAFVEFDRSLPDHRIKPAEDRPSKESEAKQSESEAAWAADRNGASPAESTSSAERPRPLAIPSDGDSDTGVSPASGSASVSSTPTTRRHAYFSSSPNAHIDTGSTASVLIIDLTRRRFTVAHIGDSRVLVFKTRYFNPYEPRKMQNPPFPRQFPNRFDMDFSDDSTADVPDAPFNSFSHRSRSISSLPYNQCDWLYVSRDHNPNEQIETKRLKAIIRATKRGRRVSNGDAQQSNKRRRLDPLQFLIGDEEDEEAAVLCRLEPASDSSDPDASDYDLSSSAPATFSLIDSRIYTADHAYSLNVCRGFGDRNFKVTPNIPGAMLQQPGTNSNGAGHANGAAASSSGVPDPNQHAVSSEPDCFVSSFADAINGRVTQNPIAANAAHSSTVDDPDSPVYLCFYLASDGVWNSVFPSGVREVDERQEINNQVMQWTVHHTLAQEEINRMKRKALIRDESAIESSAPTPLMNSVPLEERSKAMQKDEITESIHTAINQKLERELSIPATPVLSSSEIGDWQSAATPEASEASAAADNRAASEHSDLAGLSPGTLVRSDTIRLDSERTSTLTPMIEAEDWRYSASLAKSLDYLIAKAPINRNNAKQTDNMTAILCTIRIERKLKAKQPQSTLASLQEEPELAESNGMERKPDQDIKSL